MKHLDIRNISFLLLLLTFWSCEQNKVGLYEGPDLVHFIEESANMIVTEDDPAIIIEIGTTKVLNHDRSYTVRFSPDGSTAQEGYDFEIVQEQVLIPAGETHGSFEVKGLYTGASPDGTVANFVIESATEGVADFKNVFALDLYKFCSYDRDAFIGNYTIHEYSVNYGYYNYQASTRPGEDAYSIYIDNLWLLGSEFPVKVSFNDRANTCYIPEQEIFVHEVYGQAYIKSLTDGTFNSCKGFIDGLEYTIYVEAGYFDITTSIWRPSTGPSPASMNNRNWNDLPIIPFDNKEN